MKSSRIAVALVLVLALLTGFSTVALADEAEVSVNASATVYMQPERVTFSIGVNEREETVVKAQSKVNETIASIIGALTEAGIAREDISASYLSIYADYNYNITPPEITGYSATHELTVKTMDIENIGKFIDAALNAGANQLNSVSFGVVDGSPAYREALSKAVVIAKEKAQVLAEASGQQLGGLVKIEEQPTYDMYNAMYSNVAYEKDGAGGAAGTEVVTGNIGVTASVIVVYELAK